MARNLNRINSWYQKQAAWADWQDAAARAILAGYSWSVEELVPPDSASANRIDRATKKLCAAANIELPEELREVQP
jgi:hypothetical protein